MDERSFLCVQIQFFSISAEFWKDAVKNVWSSRIVVTTEIKINEDDIDQLKKYLEEILTRLNHLEFDKRRSSLSLVRKAGNNVFIWET